MKKLIISAIAILGFSAISFGQATATSSASATIVTPIGITNTAVMNFGNVAVQTATGGTVILAPAGTRTTGGAGGVTLPSVTGTVTAASFTVSGQSNYNYAITLPSTATVANGANTMLVNTFTSFPSATGTLSAGGTQTLTVGATLNVTANQAVGSYTTATPFDVIVNYN
jgi:hypothetical protein